MTTPTTMPTGKLMWGAPDKQEYYIPSDDRLVITALSNGTAGVVVPVIMTAGTGLTVNLTGWLAIADCGDSTNAVVGTPTSSQIAETAGGASARTDILWADIDVTDGTWTLAFINAAAAAGRQGVQLGQVTVPAGATQASQMTFTPAAASGGAADRMIGYADVPPGSWPNSGVWLTRADITFTLTRPARVRILNRLTTTYSEDSGYIICSNFVDPDSGGASVAGPGGTRIDFMSFTPMPANFAITTNGTVITDTLAAGQHTVNQTIYLGGNTGTATLDGGQLSAFIVNDDSAAAVAQILNILTPDDPTQDPTVAGPTPSAQADAS